MLRKILDISSRKEGTVELAKQLRDAIDFEKIAILSDEELREVENDENYPLVL